MFLFLNQRSIFKSKLGSLLGAPPNLEKLLQCKSSGHNLMHNSCVTSVLFPLVLLNLIIVLSVFRYHKLWRRTRRSARNNPSENSPLIESGNVRARFPERDAHFSFPFLISIGSVIAFILIELSVIIIHALADSIWLSTVYTLYLLVTLLTWCACTTVLLLDFQFLGTTSESWIAHWFGGLVFPVELLIASRWLNAVTDNYSKDSWQVGLLSLYALRFASTGFFFYLSMREILKRDRRNTTSVLESESEPESASRPVKSKSFYQQFIRVAPYMWSRNDVRLQLYVLAAFALLIIGRVIGPLTPYQYKIIVDSLSKVKPDPNSGLSYDLWTAVVTYGILRLLQGGNGFISSIQAWVLIPINQFTTRKVSLDTFSHLHLLSLDFHIKRKTGEVLRVMDRGTSSIVQLMNYVVFSIFPTITDIVVAVFLLLYMFDLNYSLIVLVSMLFYMWITIAITEWRTKFRRAMNEHSNAVSAIAVDSLLNFETVKYFNAESFEVERYDEAMIKFLKADLQNSASLPILNLVQNFILIMAVLAGSLLCSYEVAHGTKTVGDFIYFNTYLLQLSVPLNFFGTLYRMIQQSFIDMEKMLELLEVEQTVFDIPGASELNNRAGCEVTFDDVEFSYSDDSKTLNKLNFTVAPGKTYALVGPSGGGKSTILKLLFRFYDVKSGFIKIDGQDISKVTQSSLRRIIGVVPQDTVLFNDSIRYNIRYGNPSASDWEVEYAAKMAQIHERILSFPQGYDTVVGERGLRLSGGEKQRVAIARTFLKNPRIVLLDEATSALDTTTERQIQESFNLITEGRTTLVIAHRLSTVVSADCILCIQDGKIAEQGTHSELLEKGGLYASMWVKQLES